LDTVAVVGFATLPFVVVEIVADFEEDNNESF